jgi:6-phosphogluconolactonase
VDIDEDKGTIRIVRLMTVVDEVADPAREISLEEARYDDEEFQVGDVMEQPVDLSEFGRMARDLPWERVRFTFGDERCVPPNDSESNFRMAREALFAPYSVPDSSILRMRGEIDPQLAAQEYEDQLALLATQHGETMYRHDLMLLGMGDDGHTASLFPGTAALGEQVRRVVANFVPELKAWRLTMTLPLINHSRQVLFLVSGEKNRDLLERVLEGDQKFPASRVAPANGGLTWIIGQPASA